MQIRSVVVAAALGLASVAHGQQAVQWRVEDGGNGHWYRLKTTSAGITWTQASLEAQGSGAHLATLTSEPEQSFVAGYLLSIPGHGESAVRRWGPWIGARQFPTPRSPEPHGGWTWVTQEEWDFEFWWSGNPNNQCSETGQEENFLSVGGWYVGGGGVWNDLPEIGCDNDPVVSALLEWSADCNDDGIVDYGQCSDGSLPDYDGNNVPDCCEAGVPCTVGNYPIQWRVDDGGNGHWYHASVAQGGLGWTAARTAAEQQGGMLACAEILGEKLFLLTRFSPQRVPDAWVRQLPWTEPNFGPWLGGIQEQGAVEPNGGWAWITGVQFDPSDIGCCNNIGCAGPEDRLHLFWIGGQMGWNDLPDTWTCGTMPTALIVEWSADCNNDGIVDYGQILDGTFTDTDENGVPDPCEVDPCPGDITGGGQVNGVDLAAILGAWGTDGQGKLDCDINDDGTVDAQDLAIVLGGWGNCP